MMTESEIRRARMRLLAEQWAEITRHAMTARERLGKARDALKKLVPFLECCMGLKDEMEDELERLELAEEGPLALLPERGTHSGRYWVLEHWASYESVFLGDEPIIVMGPKGSKIPFVVGHPALIHCAGVG